MKTTILSSVAAMALVASATAMSANTEMDADGDRKSVV